MLIGAMQANAFGQFYTGSGLMTKQTLKAKQNIAVAKLTCQCLIINMCRVAALMNVLRHKIILQAAPRVFLAAITLKPC